MEQDILKGQLHYEALDDNEKKIVEMLRQISAEERALIMRLMDALQKNDMEEVEKIGAVIKEAGAEGVPW